MNKEYLIFKKKAERRLSWWYLQLIIVILTSSFLTVSIIANHNNSHNLFSKVIAVVCLTMLISFFLCYFKIQKLIDSIYTDNSLPKQDFREGRFILIISLLLFPVFLFLAIVKRNNFEQRFVYYIVSSLLLGITVGFISNLINYRKILRTGLLESIYHGIIPEIIIFILFVCAIPLIIYPNLNNPIFMVFMLWMIRIGDSIRFKMGFGTKLMELKSPELSGTNQMYF